MIKKWLYFLIHKLPILIYTMYTFPKAVVLVFGLNIDFGSTTNGTLYGNDVVIILNSWKYESMVNTV